MRRYLVLGAVIAFFSFTAAAGTLDRPLPADAKVLRQSEFSVGASGQVSDIIIARDGRFTLDYVVAGATPIRTVILTDEQYRQANSGRKPKKPFVMDVAVQGSGSQSIRLATGTYHILWMGDAAAHMSYRAWWQSE